MTKFWKHSVGYSRVFPYSQHRGIIIAVLGVLIVALYIWLSIRIINRHERWAKRMACALLCPLYFLGIGPAICIAGNVAPLPHRAEKVLEILYWPLCFACDKFPQVVACISLYVNLCTER